MEPGRFAKKGNNGCEKNMVNPFLGGSGLFFLETQQACMGGGGTSEKEGEKKGKTTKEWGAK